MNEIMNITPIKTEQDYHTALARVEQLWGAEPDTQDSDELEILFTLVEAYEAKHYPVLPPDPIEAIKFEMDNKGLKHKDLEAYLGSRSRVSEILNGKRRLSMEMIKRLHKGLGIPLESLIGMQPAKSSNKIPSDLYDAKNGSDTAFVLHNTSINTFRYPAYWEKQNKTVEYAVFNCQETDMFGEHHTLPHEFPEHTDLIKQLVANNAEFKTMAEEYNALDEEIIQIEQNVEAVSDTFAEDLKKKRALLKDKIYAMLQQTK